MSPNPRQVNGESGRVWAVGRFGEVSHSEAKEIFFVFLYPRYHQIIICVLLRGTCETAIQVDMDGSAPSLNIASKTINRQYSRERHKADIDSR
jgi:hypothetical protein